MDPRFRPTLWPGTVVLPPPLRPFEGVAVHGDWITGLSPRHTVNRKCAFRRISTCVNCWNFKQMTWRRWPSQTVPASRAVRSQLGTIST